MFTKGEWKQGSLSDEPFTRSSLSIYREDGRKIAEISREGFMPIEEAEANAHLISAAPDMYEALRGLMTAYNIDRESIIVNLDPEYWQRALEAMAKAEGINE